MRVGRRVFQRRALYLGELNDSQRSEWQRAVEAFGDDSKPHQLKLFPLGHPRRYQPTSRLKKRKCSEDLRHVS